MSETVKSYDDVFSLCFSYFSDKLQEAGQPPQGGWQGQWLPMQMEQGAALRKKAPGDYKILFLVTFQKWSATITNPCFLRFGICIEVGPVWATYNALQVVTSSITRRVRDHRSSLIVACLLSLHVRRFGCMCHPTVLSNRKKQTTLIPQNLSVSRKWG